MATPIPRTITLEGGRSSMGLARDHKSDPRADAVFALGSVDQGPGHSPARTGVAACAVVPIDGHRTEVAIMAPDMASLRAAVQMIFEGSGGPPAMPFSERKARPALFRELQHGDTFNVRRW